MDYEIKKSDDEWRVELNEEQFAVLRGAATERAWTGELLDEDRSGLYTCAGCGEPLFDSDEKYDSGSGWPSYTAPMDDAAVTEHADTSHGMRRIEVRCARCAGHLGHVFPDGPGPTGLRYCINSAALKFQDRSA